ncbi:MAG: PH domain-containing protein [Gemmatimonadetes bacterium]|nr:PH domain-containing protein [Gemmatimonadota bacterium]
MSLRRIEIEYDGYNSLLVSPDDCGAFLAELARRAPHARIDDSDA